MHTRRTFLASAAALSAADSVSLFDGETTRGWRAVGSHTFPTNCWSVVDGCLKAMVVQSAFQDIRTVDEFEDFDLEFEWKILPNGNSGVKYLIYKEDVWKSPGSTEAHARGRGFEYQIADGTGARKELEAAGGVYEFVAPTGAQPHPTGEFNTGRIVRRGTSIEHWLNGSRVVNVRWDAPEMQARMRERKMPTDLPRRTPVVLQHHHSEAWFRRLRIHSL